MEKDFVKKNKAKPVWQSQAVTLGVELIASFALALLGNLIAAWISEQTDFPIHLVIFFVVIIISTILFTIAFRKKSTIIAAGAVFVIGSYIGVEGFFSKYSSDPSFQNFASEYYANVSTELIAIAFTVVIIDSLNEMRQQTIDDAREIEFRERVNSLESRLLNAIRINQPSEQKLNRSLFFHSILVFIGFVLSLLVLWRNSKKNKKG